MTQPKIPARQLAVAAESGLNAAKQHYGKNAVSLWGVTVGWAEWRTLMKERRDALERLISEAGVIHRFYLQPAAVIRPGGT